MKRKDDQSTGRKPDVVSLFPLRYFINCMANLDFCFGFGIAIKAISSVLNLVQSEIRRYAFL
jgi:hypothetical protein